LLRLEVMPDHVHLLVEVGIHVRRDIIWHQQFSAMA
jgi:REP element-mobilizing transposase RayT